MLARVFERSITSSSDDIMTAVFETKIKRKAFENILSGGLTKFQRRIKI